MIRELEYSKITIRIRRKGGKSVDEKEDSVYAKMTAQTLMVLERHLVSQLHINA